MLIDVAQSPYEKREIRRAINLCAISGWVAVAGVPLGSELLINGFDPTLKSLFFLFTLIGLPLSFLIVWVLVAPALRVVSQKPIGYLRAAKWGIGIGCGLVGVSILLGRLFGWLQSIGPDFNATRGGIESERSVDGILTPYGWRILTQDSALFILACALIALLVRWQIGPGTKAASRTDG